MNLISGFFSSEAQMNSSEVSTPILPNNLFDLNQIVAICTLYKALNARLNGGTGLHINIGVDYLECNEKAIENLLKIWGECEELFFKIANPEGEEIFDIYHRYNIEMKKRPNEDDKVRWTSINFNHMKWNSNNPGRIEIRIFNSSLEPEIIFQNLLLVGKMF